MYNTIILTITHIIEHRLVIKLLYVLINTILLFGTFIPLILYFMNIYLFIYMCQIIFILYFKNYLSYDIHDNLNLFLNIKFTFKKILISLFTNLGCLLINYYNIKNINFFITFSRTPSFLSPKISLTNIKLLVTLVITTIWNSIILFKSTLEKKINNIVDFNIVDFITVDLFNFFFLNHIIKSYNISLENYTFFKSMYNIHYNVNLKIETYIYFIKLKFFKRVADRNEYFGYFLVGIIYNNINLKNINYLYLNINYLYTFFKKIILSLLLVIFTVIYLLYYFKLNLIRQLAIWFVIGMIFFWLISGFNFFIKRYRFGKFTSVICRFWKRANIYFWIIEGFLFCIFFYYYLNSSQEPTYMYDTVSLQQDYLINIISFYFNLLLLIFIIIYLYYLMLNIQNFINTQNLQHLLIVTLLIIYIYIIESYQFFYTITIFFENIWEYNYDNLMWTLEVENPRLRLKHQYGVLILIAKYWHFIFIFISWLFLIFKIFEQKRSYITISGVNIQNLIILFWLNILFISQWIKWSLKRFYNTIYYWFLTDSNNIFFKNIISEFFYLIRDNI